MDLCIPQLDVPLLPDCSLFDITDTAGVWCGAIYDDHDFMQARHRYALWRVWAPEARPLVVIGLNPSTATHLVLDPTVRRDIRYARDWGYGGLVKLNLFSYRSTDPNALYRHEPNIDPVTGGVTNNDYIKWFCDRDGLVLCAWGNHGNLYNRGDAVVRLLTERGVKLFALSQTKEGQPGHTLYLRANLQPQPFSVGN